MFKSQLRALWMTLVTCLLVTAPLFAIPDITHCPNGEVAYATGFIPIDMVAFENSPRKPDTTSAILSATSRCRAKWSSSLGYANAGSKVTAQINAAGTGYNFTCWKCVGAEGPNVVYQNRDPALEAIEMATGVLPGVVTKVTTVDTEFEGEIREFYVVSVANGEPGFELVQDVLVDLSTHHVIVQEIVLGSASCN